MQNPGTRYLCGDLSRISFFDSGALSAQNRNKSYPL